MKPINIFWDDTLFFQLELCTIKVYKNSLDISFHNSKFRTGYNHEYELEPEYEIKSCDKFFSMLLMEIEDATRDKSVITKNDINTACKKAVNSALNLGFLIRHL
jgi:hypothetical protein